MENQTIFNITNNENGESLKMELQKGGSLRIVKIPSEPTDDCRDIFLSISNRQSQGIEICMAETGMVENASMGMVAGFPKRIYICLPEYLLPLLKQAINQL